MSIQQQIDAKITELTETLQSGETSTTIDGTTTTVDLDCVRQERDNLAAQSKKQRLKRPRLSSVNLGGAMG